MRAAALPLATAALFSGSYVAGKIATAELEPLTTTLARYAVALVVLGALAPRFGPRALRIRRADLGLFIGLGLSGIVGYHYFFFLALRHTSAANTAIINATSPVLTGLAAAVVLRERLSARSHAGIVIACVGVLTLLTDADPARALALELNRGDLLMLASVACWVVYALLLKHLVARYSGYTLTFHATLWGVVLVSLLAAPERPLDQLANVSTETALSVLYMGAFASGAGYLLYSYSVAALGPTRTSSVVYGAVPVLVAVLGLVVLGEPITAVMAASTVLIVLGLRLVLAEP